MHQEIDEPRARHTGNDEANQKSCRAPGLHRRGTLARPEEILFFIGHHAQQCAHAVHHVLTAITVHQRKRSFMIAAACLRDGLIEERHALVDQGRELIKALPLGRIVTDLRAQFLQLVRDAAAGRLIRLEVSCASCEQKTTLPGLRIYEGIDERLHSALNVLCACHPLKRPPHLSRGAINKQSRYSDEQERQKKTDRDQHGRGAGEVRLRHSAKSVAASRRGTTPERLAFSTRQRRRCRQNFSVNERARILLLSTSTVHGSGYLDYAEAEVRDFLAEVRRLLFVPFALANRDAYAARVRERFGKLGCAVESLHTADDRHAAIAQAEAIFVGGGNTFRLLKVVQDHGLVAAIRDRVEQGMPYIGSSAGSNIAAPTIRTTNDMPIVEPTSFRALGLVPFQINPHFLDADPASTHMGETREERLLQYLEENDTPVVALREGAWLRLERGECRLRGSRGGRLYVRGEQPAEIADGTSLQMLLR
jgi:dipeptidase E